MRPTWAEVRLDHIADNFHYIKGLVSAETKILAAIKADAYGHGAVPIATRLEKEGIDWFGVALAEEGIKLREAGISMPILCLGGFWRLDQAKDCVNHQLTPAIYRRDMLDTLASAAQEAGRAVAYHLKIDTGMGRLGITMDELPTFLEHARRFPNLQMDGVMTHLASADEPDKNEFTKFQLANFQQAKVMLTNAGFQPTFHHSANSAGTFNWPAAHGNLVRAGGLLYGFRDATAPEIDKIAVKPALSLHSRIILLKHVPANKPLGYGNSYLTKRDSLIATLPIGYDDGLRRAYSNCGRVIVRGSFAPIVGRVSMDLTLIDVTDVADVQLGDEALLLGSAQDLTITAEEMGHMIGTISYEVTCALTGRVPRFFLNQPDDKPIC